MEEWSFSNRILLIIVPLCKALCKCMEASSKYWLQIAVLQVLPGLSFNCVNYRLLHTSRSYNPAISCSRKGNPTETVTKTKPKLTQNQKGQRGRVLKLKKRNKPQLLSLFLLENVCFQERNLKKVDALSAAWSQCSVFYINFSANYAFINQTCLQNLHYGKLKRFTSWLRN